MKGLWLAWSTCRGETPWQSEREPGQCGQPGDPRAACIAWVWQEQERFYRLARWGKVPSRLRGPRAASPLA